MASSAGTFLSLFHRRKRQQNCYQQKAFAINCIHAIKKNIVLLSYCEEARVWQSLTDKWA